jgi:uncharacterized protein DUF1499
MTTRQSTPRLVNWIGYLGITLLAALPLAVLMVRANAWQQGLLLYALSCLGAGLLLIFAIVLMLLPRFAPWRSAIGQRAVMAVPGTLLLLSTLGSQGDFPAIHDITTDTDDPPVFTAAAAQRGAGANSLKTLPETIEAQLAAYPELATIKTDISIESAFYRAGAIARELGWEIYREDLNAGYIEAVDTTTVMGFKDDVVIRLRTNAGGTLVDLRSVSRVGRGDLGANAARINAFIERFNAP